MNTTKVKYVPTPMVGWRDGDIYNLTTYHVSPLSGLHSLTLPEATMIADFMNRLTNPQSVRAIQSRVMTSTGKGINKLLYPRRYSVTFLDPGETVDRLQLRVVEGVIVWSEESILERLENEVFNL
jgi:hypothetical protein